MSLFLSLSLSLSVPLSVSVSLSLSVSVSVSLSVSVSVYFFVFVFVFIFVFVFASVAYLHCPAGWEFYGTSCYKFNIIRRSWAAAKQDCHKLGGYLLKINNADEQHYISYKAQRINGVRRNFVL